MALPSRLAEVIHHPNAAKLKFTPGKMGLIAAIGSDGFSQPKRHRRAPFTAICAIQEKSTAT